ncbi:phenylacetyl-CoA ligase [Xylariaceae sp. FL0662B]|nr:phenylacetyl-CoA ligase [Xylariaceae sp. FL0662B]
MPFESRYTPLQIPNTDICNFVFDGFDDIPPEKVLFIGDDGSQSYNASKLRQTALSFSEGLVRHMQWRKGHVLALVSLNSVHVPPVILGGLIAGGIISPANPAYGVNELVHQFRDSGARAIVTQQPFLPVVLDAAAIVGIPRNRIVVLPDARTPASLFSPSGEILEFTEIISTQERGTPKINIDPKDDLAFLVYTSGTTGLPKGAEITHRNIVSNLLMADAAASLDPDDTVLAFLPFYHIYGLTMLVFYTLHRRARVVVMPRFTPVDFCQVVESYRVSIAYIVPPVAAMLSQSDLPARHSLASIRFMVSAGAPLSEELIRALHSRWRIRLIQGYGLTETSPGAFMMSLSDFPAANGTVGQLLPNQQAKLLDIKDPTVEVTLRGHPGQLCIRGPNIFKGYHNNPAATEAAFTPDGFFLTGDVGIVDDAGYLRITDRIKELIKYKGFQVAPAELEGLLMGHEGVSDVCVFGIQDHNLATEVPRAYVVRKPGWQLSDKAAAEDIRNWIDERVAHYKRLRGGVHFVENLPRTASGKLLRRELKSIGVREKL